MAAEVFVDTSAWFPLTVRGDSAHEPLAAALRDRVRRSIRVVTTNLVLAETHALLLRRTSRETALAFVRRIDQPPTVVVRSTSELEAAAIADWLDRYADHDFSFTDGVSFAVMAERGITEALTLDRHFATAGFRVRP